MTTGEVNGSIEDVPVGWYGEWIPTRDPPLLKWWVLLPSAFPEPDPLERQWWPQVEVGPG